MQSIGVFTLCSCKLIARRIRFLLADGKGADRSTIGVWESSGMWL